MKIDNQMRQELANMLDTDVFKRCEEAAKASVSTNMSDETLAPELSLRLAYEKGVHAAFKILRVIAATVEQKPRPLTLASLSK